MKHPFLHIPPSRQVAAIRAALGTTRRDLPGFSCYFCSASYYRGAFDDTTHTFFTTYDRAIMAAAFHRIGCRAVQTTSTAVKNPPTRVLCPECAYHSGLIRAVDLPVAARQRLGVEPKEQGTTP